MSGEDALSLLFIVGLTCCGVYFTRTLQPWRRSPGSRPPSRMDLASSWFHYALAWGLVAMGTIVFLAWLVFIAQRR